MDLPIGAEFVHEEKKYLIVENTSCWPCAFFDYETDRCSRPADVTGHCSALLREDGRTVCYVKV